ncbi:unnamed protein product [Fusarium graminearum]|uniref:Uncharacterized protein n=1 Tax=Gibberella zeae TaxID=5518 RepID=A0A4E9E9Y8_GIBZA|nr:unnamed protein product [Fusarium graminearum]CAF3453291.1 unnamed protein product [Fusarium graminearum]CAF3530948.1 unnamed protein product [Fusarium graminearum]CAG1983647.1 unnamed protein product [Fusarium graminearum]CAG1990657.1 unnamed protein product [Fusarium graminearum]
MPFGKASFRTADSERYVRGPVIAGHILPLLYTRLSRLQIRYLRHLAFVKIDDACAVHTHWRGPISAASMVVDMPPQMSVNVTRHLTGH